MKSYVAGLATALVIPALAALGGAFAVYAGYDDAPGGVLIGFALIAGAAVLSLGAARRNR
ncbi:MAG: hypothetical protein FIB01_05130 [Gemmatimonadetes bacterium]|nr:hypothetical protein [Gemmatimonadota bacterium]